MSDPSQWPKSDPSQWTARQWRDNGHMVATEQGGVFVLDRPADTDGGAPPLLVVHGFPSSSYDYRHVLAALGQHRRVILVDQLGFGWSDKPDRRYGIRLHADSVEQVLASLGVTTVDLLTHDMGDTVGGELLARSLEGTNDLVVRRRVVTDGSIYLDIAQLTAGQLALLDLPDERLELLTAANVAAGLAATFSADHPASDDEIAQQTELVAHLDGQALLPRTIRYLEDRRAEERRFTGAIEQHAAPLAVIWGVEDPVSVVAMTDLLLAARPDLTLTLLDGVGHYPMVEAPERFSAAVLDHLGPA